MRRYVLVGNSGSGKSTLARRLTARWHLAHLDLDTLAWQPTKPPQRRRLEVSAREIRAFMDVADDRVVEGCYADLAKLALDPAACLVFLNPGTDACLANARARPWEAHKYTSREAQDANLEMLLGWTRDYPTRDDEQSLSAHRALFEEFSGRKVELVSRQEVATFEC